MTPDNLTNMSSPDQVEDALELIGYTRNRGRDGAYHVWEHDWFPDVLVPLDPTFGDYNGLLARAEQAVAPLLQLVEQTHARTEARLRAEQQSRDDTLTEALEKMRSILELSGADNSAEHDRAALWAVLVGWDCEQDHDCTVEQARDGADCDGQHLDKIAERWGWTPAQVADIRRLRSVVRTTCR